MLIIIGGLVNPIDIRFLTQKKYDELIGSLDFSTYKCKLCGNVGFETHAYYDRGVIVEHSFRLVVKRIRCPNCGKTHALLPQSLVPYSQIPLETTVEIIKLKTEKDIRQYLDSVTYLAEEVIRMVQKKYKKFWRNRLISHQISVDNQVSAHCLDTFGYQFMQLRFPLTIAYRQFHIEQPTFFFSS